MLARCVPFFATQLDSQSGVYRQVRQGWQSSRKGRNQCPRGISGHDLPCHALRSRLLLFLTFDPVFCFFLRALGFQTLERVALAYPRALFYPLLMTKASAEARRGRDGGGTVDRQRLSKLSALTFDASGEAFAEVK